MSWRRQGRGRADDQAPRRDRRPAGLAARRGRGLRRGRVLSRATRRRREAEAAETGEAAAEARLPLAAAGPGPRHPGARPALGTRPFYIGFFGGLGALLAYFLWGALLSVSSYLVLIVVAMFLAAGLNPAVEFFMRRGLRRGYAVLVVIAAVAGRGHPVRARDRAGHHRPGRRDHRERPRMARRAPAQPQVQQLDDKYDLISRVKDYVARATSPRGVFGGVLGRRAWRCSPRWPTPSSSWC